MVIPNLRKVLWADFYWTRKGSNARRDEKPVEPTVNGTIVTQKDLELNPHVKPDLWFAKIELRFSASNTFVATGPIAEKLWEAYKGVVYNGGAK